MTIRRVTDDHPPSMSVRDGLESSAGSPDSLAVVDGRGAMTYRELTARVGTRAAEIASRMTSEDRRAGDVVSFVAETTVASVIELLAVWRSGAVAAPLNARLTDAERDTARRELEGTVLPKGTQVVLWTSGTSGRPRGVALSWPNLEASARAAADRLDLGPSDVWLASLSPAHVGGLALVTRSLLLGGVLIVPRSRDIRELSRILDGEGIGAPASIGEEGAAQPIHTYAPRVPTDDSVVPTHPSLVPTHVSLVPTQLHRLLEQREGRGAPETLRCVLVGGAHAPASLVERALEAGWPLALTYGATEMTSQIATAPPALTRSEPGTVGPPLPGVEVRVDAAGELWTRGPTRALGYVGGEAQELADSDGWYRTGDLGRLDEGGHLWITGRRIDRIVSGGVTVDAVEVEEALRAHPTVIDACVVGVPDEEWGERVGAWVEPVEGELELEELDRHLRELLTGAKLPRVWHVAPGIPRNANGKADRGAVRRKLVERPPAGG